MNLIKSISFAFLSLILLVSCSKAAPSPVHTGDIGRIISAKNATDPKSRILQESEIELENGKKTDFHSGITVESDKVGRCTFKDSLNNITRPLDIKIDKSDTIINAEVRSTFIEVNAVTGECF